MKIPFNLRYFSEEGVEAQEVAEPVETEEVTENPTEEEAQVSEPEPTGNKTEEDSRFAAVRRQAEEYANNKVNSEFRRVFGDYTNPVTGQSISSWQDYLSAIEAQNRMAREQELISKGVDPKLIDEMVNNSPAMRQANMILQNSMKAEAAQRFIEDLKEVSKIDPAIQSEADLQKLPCYPQIYEYVANHGLSLPEAFKLANYTAIRAKQTEAVKQAAVNLAKGKDHMGTTQGVATNSTLVEVPTSTLSKMREFYPDLTDAQIKEKYNATL